MRSTSASGVVSSVQLCSPMRSWSGLIVPLPHGVSFFDADLVQHALLPGLAERILVLPEVFPRHLVDMRVGALLRDLPHPPAHFDVAIRILRIHDSDGNARVAPDVPVLLPPNGR